MNKIITTNCLYHFENRDFNEENSLLRDQKLNGLSKLSLLSDELLAVQVKCFLEFLNNCETEIKFYFDFNQSKNHWTLYANYPVLNQILLLLNDTQFDYLLWPEQVFSPPRLMLFDMDSTFIEIEVIDELAKLHQVGLKVSQITESAMRGELDFAESLISRVACLQGLSSNSINEIAENLPLSKGVIALVDAARSNHCLTAIVSGGFSPFVELLKNKFDLFKVKANHLEIISEQLTGKLLGEIVDAKAKAVFLESLCEELKILPSEVIAIGDGANDLLMMQAAGFNLAYYAKPKVQQQAKGRMNHTSLNRLIELFGW